MTYNGNNKDTKKEMREKELKEFRSTFNRLRSKFTLEELEQITGIAKSNLSAYGKGKKNPSKRTIERFYTTLKTHIDKLTTQDEPQKDDEHANRVEEEPMPYNYDMAEPDKPNKEDLKDKMLRLLQDTNDRMWAETERNAKRFDRILDNNTQLTHNNTILVNANAKLVENNTQMVTTNTRMVDKLLSGSGT